MVPATSSRKSGSRSLSMASAASIHCDNGLVAQRGNVVEDRILRAVNVPAAHQTLHGFGLQRLRPVAVDIRQRHENRQRLIVDGLAQKAEHGLHHVVPVLPVQRGPGQLRVVLVLWTLGEQVLPGIEAAGQVNAAVGVERRRVVSSIISAFERKTGRAGPGVVTRPRTAE